MADAGTRQGAGGRAGAHCCAILARGGVERERFTMVASVLVQPTDPPTSHSSGRFITARGGTLSARVMIALSSSVMLPSPLTSPH